MKRWICVIMIAMLLLAGCGPEPAQEAAETPEIQTQIPEDTQAPAEKPAQEPTQASTEPPAQAPAAQAHPQVPEGRTDLGSAGEVNGTTLLVTIFAEDAGTQWDPEAEQDRVALDVMQLHLEEGVDWLTAQVEAYGANAQFLYAWEEGSDLCYTVDFGDQTLVRADGGGYHTQENYINANIPTQTLKDKYRARNVIYLFFFNTGEDNTVNSWSLSDRSGVEAEIINVFVRDDYYDSFYYMPAASFAHEIMHCFGAYDLYYASEVIPQAYVDHCATSNSNDIMYTVGLGSVIDQAFTQLDAYYMGLLDSCPEVDTWGLGKSSHLQ